VAAAAAATFLSEWREVALLLWSSDLWQTANANMSGVVLLPIAAALTPPFVELLAVVAFVVSSLVMVGLLATKSARFSSLYVAAVLVLTALVVGSARGASAARMTAEALQPLIDASRPRPEEEALIRNAMDRYETAVVPTATALVWAWLGYAIWIPPVVFVVAPAIGGPPSSSRATPRPRASRRAPRATSIRRKARGTGRIVRLPRRLQPPTLDAQPQVVLRERKQSAAAGVTSCPRNRRRPASSKPAALVCIEIVNQPWSYRPTLEMQAQHDVAAGEGARDDRPPRQKGPDTGVERRIPEQARANARGNCCPCALSAHRVATAVARTSRMSTGGRQCSQE
jgi:hypothetical protein